MRLDDDERDVDTDVNITPLIDVVFLLLIFFMVSTTFSQYSELQIELPESSAERREMPPEVIEISIDKSGNYFVKGKQLVNNSMETLKRALLKESGGNRSTPIVISADARTPHQADITAMDAARQAGLTRLSFSTTKSSE